jgi:acyl-[acyl carrier protein]--UDP-N-acetylglucosamine O-acyltransferase
MVEPQKIDIRNLHYEGMTRLNKEIVNISDCFHVIYNRAVELEQENQSLKAQIIELNKPKT